MEGARFPLKELSHLDIQALSKTLWSWSVCEKCAADQCCISQCCWNERSTNLKRFFQTYRDITAKYDVNTSRGQPACLSTHADLLRIVGRLKTTSNSTRLLTLQSLFPSVTITRDHELALNIAVRVSLMVDCATGPQSTWLLESGNHEISWLDNQTLCEFVSKAFPEKAIIDDVNDIVANLRAAKLQTAAKIIFTPTDDLRNHLRLDNQRRMVQVFHHTGFLKEQLRLTKDQSRNLPVARSLEL